MKTTLLRLLLTLLFFNWLVNGNAQNALIISPYIRMPKDSLLSQKLISSFNAFIERMEDSNKENTLALSKDKLAANILSDEMKELNKSKLNYKIHLNNVLQIDDSTFALQIAYLTTNNDSPLLGSMISWIAYKQKDQFVFGSPLIRNTKTWKTFRKDGNIFHYQNDINKANIEKYISLKTAFDKKIGISQACTEFYCFDDFLEMGNACGLAYKLNYNGRNKLILSTSSDYQSLILLGNNNGRFDSFDPHDLWHDRLNLKVSRDSVNKSVDEGCAYLYGGSWGFSWQEIFREFDKQVAKNKNTDWLVLKEKPSYFKTGNYYNSADYIVTALLIKKMEKEKGFSAVWDMLLSGPAQKGNEKYFEILKTIGITKANYNDKIEELIHAEVRG